MYVIRWKNTKCSMISQEMSLCVRKYLYLNTSVGDNYLN